MAVSWLLLGVSRAPLGRLLDALGRLLGTLGRSLGASWLPWRAPGTPGEGFGACRSSFFELPGHRFQTIFGMQSLKLKFLLQTQIRSNLRSFSLHQVWRSVRSTSAASRRESRACQIFIHLPSYLPASKACFTGKAQNACPKCLPPSFYSFPRTRTDRRTSSAVCS